MLMSASDRIRNLHPGHPADRGMLLGEQATPELPLRPVVTGSSAPTSPSTSSPSRTA